MNTREALEEVALQVDDLEEEHNEALDMIHHAQTQMRRAQKDLAEGVDALRERMKLLKVRADTALLRSQRAPVIASLLGQQEEVAPIEQRLEKQQYEQYMRSEEFIEALKKEQ